MPKNEDVCANCKRIWSEHDMTDIVPWCKDKKGEYWAKTQWESTWLTLMPDFTAAVRELVYDCPHRVDESTIPSDGINANQQQVVWEYSISEMRLRKIRTMLKQMEDKE